MIKLFNILFLSLLIIGCNQYEENKVVSDINDYQYYLRQPKQDLSALHDQVDLWKSKIEKEPDGFLFYEKLGASYHKIFEKTRNIEFLHHADRAYLKARKITKGKWQIPSLLSLSSISVKKHDFKSAAYYAVQARELTDEKFGPLLMQFDAEMELGNYQMAGAILKEHKRMDSFDYLVRLSKYKDYEGDLDSAVFYMEQAKKLISRNQKERMVWATANLGDMYGHAGRIEESYQHYLKVLNLDPTFDYALKGIAWVAYSNDRKTVNAINILETLRKRSSLPDYHLLLAELYQEEGHTEVANRIKNQFISEASKSEYMGMYNKYLIELYAERGAFEKAIRLAEEEISKRPTPASYDWLAWAHYQRGENEEAIRIYEKYVEGKTYEPDVVFHMGMTYAKAGRSKGKEFLLESLEASYELGPNVASEIKEKLKT